MYSQEELKTAFDQVANPDDWRDVIDAEIVTDDHELICEAITHFTSTSPKYYNVRDNVWRFYSEGYRLGPAGP
jgi:hypothetical protein